MYNKQLYGLLLLLFLCTNIIVAQEKKVVHEPVEMDLRYPSIGDTTIVGLVANEQVWIPIEDLFLFLKIKTVVSQSGKMIDGFIFQQDSLYQFNGNAGTLVYQKKTILFESNELIDHGSKLFLKSASFASLFGIECTFDYRSLLISVRSKKELPIVSFQKQRVFRQNLNKLNNIIKVDSLLKGSTKRTGLGVADWTINNVLNVNGRAEVQANLALGGAVLGGEMNAAFQYNDKTQFDNRQQYYLWRHVNNDNPLVKQIALGKINTNAISTLFAPVVGVRVSNTPTIQRNDFGTYRIDRYTEPNWTVELYINNLLVNYTKADAAGFYRFEIPVMYGNSQIMLKQYGPNGEQKMNEFNINIPYNFLPKNKLEYIVNAGIVEDTMTSRFSKAQLNYGLTNKLTIGTGVEYLSSISTGTTMPFVQANLKLGSSILLTAQYVQHVKYTMQGNFRTKRNLMIEALFTRYREGQTAIFNNYLEERNVTVSLPVRFKKCSFLPD